MGPGMAVIFELSISKIPSLANIMIANGVDPNSSPLNSMGFFRDLETKKLAIYVSLTPACFVCLTVRSGDAVSKFTQSVGRIQDPRLHNAGDADGGQNPKNCSRTREAWCRYDDG